MAASGKTVRTARTVAGAPTRSTVAKPIATYSLIAINLVVFAITVAQAGSIASNSFSALFLDWSLVPRLVGDGQFVRAIGSGFLHFGLIHLALNMFALYIIGRDTEAVLGWGRYLAVYFVSILGGSAAVMLFQVDARTAGASGAVFGLMGAQAAILVRLRRSPTPVLVVIGVNVVISVSIPGISLWGHLGGLAAGAAATGGLLYTATSDPRRGRILGWVAIAAVACIAVGIIVLRALMLQAEYR